MGSSAISSGEALPLARYRFDIRLIDPIRLPDYAGSLIRGQLGASLRRIACMTGQRRCEGCPLLRTCPYPAIFETPAPASHTLQRFSEVPNPYVVEPPPLGARVVEAGGMLSFGLVLIGRALDQLPLIAYAMQRALESGLGKQRSRASIDDIMLEHSTGQTSIWDHDSRRVLSHDAALTVPSAEDKPSLTLRFATPLRLQHQGRPLDAEELTPRRLITALMRRANLLFDLHANRPGLIEAPSELARLAEGLVDERDLRWRDWTRYSSRQQAEMKLGGVLGTWRLEGNLSPFYSLLWLGQWLHVGKNATMGLGRYTLEAMPDRVQTETEAIS
ncbi:MAG TPA: CRISPR-associated protein Cas6 [Gammaproteobacteria bacterium]|nr:CRISPR-associated protein Cas6 [Gammaproteobacteria bacterium]